MVFKDKHGEKVMNNKKNYTEEEIINLWEKKFIDCYNKSVKINKVENLKLSDDKGLIHVIQKYMPENINPDNCMVKKTDRWVYQEEPGEKVIAQTTINHKTKSKSVVKKYVFIVKGVTK